LTEGGNSVGTRTGKRVLITQADNGIRTSLQKVLQAAGYVVAIASNARETSRCFEGLGPDLLLLDLDLPPEILNDLLTWLPNRRPAAPVIALTTMPEKLKPALAARFRPVLALPLEVPLLLKQIEATVSTADPRARQNTP